MTREKTSPRGSKLRYVQDYVFSLGIAFSFTIRQCVYLFILVYAFLFYIFIINKSKYIINTTIAAPQTINIVAFYYRQNRPKERFLGKTQK